MDDRLTIANVDIHATILQAAGLPNTSAGTSMLADRNSNGVPLYATESTSRVVRPPFCAWRTREELFVRYGTGEEEFYDYRVDPYELDNRVADPAYTTRVEELRARDDHVATLSARQRDLHVRVTEVSDLVPPLHETRHLVHDHSVQPVL